MRLGPVTFLELLAGPAPAGVVAADLLALVHPPRLHGSRGGDLVDRHLRRARHARRYGARGRRRKGARLVLGGATLVLEARAGRARAGCGLPRGRDGTAARPAVLALDLDLDAEDVARELLPDRVDQAGEHLEALVLVGHERVDLREAA